MPHRKLNLSGDGTELTDTTTGDDLFAPYAIETVRVEIDARCVGHPRVVLVLDPRFVSTQINSAGQPFLDVADAGARQCNRADRASVV